MKLPSSIVAEGWIDLQSMEIPSEGYSEGSWAFDVVLHAIAEDPSYAWEILESIVKADKQHNWDEQIALGIVAELLSDHPELTIVKIEEAAKGNQDLVRVVSSLSERDISSAIFSRLGSIVTRRGK